VATSETCSDITLSRSTHLWAHGTCDRPELGDVCHILCRGCVLEHPQCPYLYWLNTGCTSRRNTKLCAVCRQAVWQVAAKAQVSIPTSTTSVTLVYIPCISIPKCVYCGTNPDSMLAATHLQQPVPSSDLPPGSACLIRTAYTQGGRIKKVSIRPVWHFFSAACIPVIDSRRQMIGK
jgi:hypothetical protein